MISGTKNYEEIFTPGAPIKSKSLLVGRTQEIEDLTKAIRRKGIHPIIIGNRGVGKTSLVRIFLEDYEKKIIINCNEKFTFQKLAEEILKNLNYDKFTILESSEEYSSNIEGKIGLFNSGIKAEHSDKIINKKKGDGSCELDSWSIFTELKKLKEKYIIVIDEYDVILPDNINIHSGIASLIKTLSDNSSECDSRIIIVGVAQSAKDLLGEHESIERSAREIYLRTLRREDVIDFFDETQKELDIKFDEKVIQKIVDNSMGYPYYVHLVCLECMDAMRNRDKKSKFVTFDDYLIGIESAIDQAFRSELRKYRNAIENLSELEILFIEKLVEFSQTPNLKRKDLRYRLKKYMTDSDFECIWVKLQQERKFIYVSRNTDIIRFADPLMAPFLKAHIMRSKHSNINQIDLFDFNK